MAAARGRSIIRGAMRGLGLALGVALASAGPARAAPPQYTAMYVFGDGWSDAGNTWTATRHVLPAPPYASGVYSNGAVWVQDLASLLGLAAPTPSRSGGADFASGGAMSGATALHALAGIDLPGQLTAFAALVRGRAPAGALYVLSAGSDDLLAAVPASPAVRTTVAAQVSGNVAGFVTRLAALGARHILVLGVPDLGRLPAAAALGAAAQVQATALAGAFNTAVRARLRAAVAPFGATAAMVDVASLLNAAIARPATDKFSNVTQACWTGGLAANPHATPCAATVAAQDAYLFWDPTHPTGRGHRMIASYASIALP